jgi:outer membrane receptor protein involved in Fe transport
VSLADGRIAGVADRLEIGAMAPVQTQMSTDIRVKEWNISPRLSIVGRQRLLAAVADSTGRLRRRTLDGYALLNVNLRRNNVFKNIDAFVTIENALDQRYRSVNLRAFNNPEELIGAPQNPRRVTVGLQVRIR